MEKKAILFVVLLVILFLLNSFVYAVDNGANDNTAGDSNLPADIGRGVEGVKDIGSKTESTLEQDVIIPENLQIPARIIFGLQGEITLQEFIVLVCVWIMFFLVISSILKITPFFEGWKAWIGGIVITCLIAITGTVRSIAIFFFSIGNIFGFLEKWSPLKIIFAIILAIIIIYCASIVTKIINKKLMLERAEIAGAKAGAGVKMAKEMYEQETGS